MVGLTALYFAAGKLGLALAFVNVSASAVWPPTGIAMAAFLALGFRVWPAIFVGAFLVNLTTQGTVWTSVGIATGNTLEGLVGALLAVRFARGIRAFERTQDIFKFALFSAVLSTTLSATLGVLSLRLGGYVSPAEAGSIWLTWWLGDATGALVVAPTLILWWNHPRVHWNRAQKWEAAAWAGTVLLLGLVIFGGWVTFSDRNYPLSLLWAPLIVSIGFRFGSREAGLAALLLACVSIWGTLQGHGPFIWKSPNESLILLQTFMAVSVTTAIAVGAVVTDRRRAISSLNFLSETSVALSGSLDYEIILRNAVQLAVPTLGDQCRVDILTPAGQKRTFGDGELPVEAAARVPALGTPEVTPHAIVVPLVARQRTFGTLLLRSHRGRYVPEDRVLVEEFAHRTAMALDNAFLYLQAQEAVRVRDEFLSIASHELKTPLTSQQLQIQGALRIARKGNPSALTPERMMGVLETVQKQGDRLTTPINNLLDLSRINAGKLQLVLENTDLSQVVTAVVDRLCAELERSGSTLSSNMQAPVVGRWDRLRLEQVATNLFTNAIKYGNGKPIAVSLSAVDSRARLSVSDSGIGISSDDQKRLFQPFERATPANHFGGLGLGLYIVRQIVEAHGGIVSVKSEAGRGSTFTVELPQLPPE